MFADVTAASDISISLNSSSGQKERKQPTALAASRVGVSERNDKAEIQKTQGQNQQWMSKLKD